MGDGGGGRHYDAIGTNWAGKRGGGITELCVGILGSGFDTGSEVWDWANYEHDMCKNVCVGLDGWLWWGRVGVRGLGIAIVRDPGAEGGT